MASVGLNIARDGSTPVSTIRSLNATWVRIVAMPDLDLSGYFRDLRAAGIKILLVLARESGGNYILYRDRYGSLVDAIQVGNEPDLASPSSWTMSQVELAALGWAVRGIFPTMPLVCAGLASGHPEWLIGADTRWANALAFHPYLKDAPNPSDLEDLQDVTTLVPGYAAYGLPLLVSEWGWWSDDEPRASEEVRDMTRWAAQTGDIEVFFYFCTSDSMVPPFGLLNADGSEKPKARAFKQEAARQIHSLWPDIQAPVEPPANPPTDLRAYAKAAAVRAGVPPLHFERQIQQESGFDPKAYNAGSGASGIAQIIPKFHPDVDPWNPTAALDYAAQYDRTLYDNLGKTWRNAFAAYNWGWGNVSTWDGRPSSLPAETRHYLDVILGPGWPEPSMPTGKVTYNKLEPAHAQEESFDCSQECLEWALWAYGRQTSDDWLESTMIAEGVMSKADGLLDASGAGLAAFINRQYGELGYSSSIENPVSFDFLAAEFGPGNPYPGLIGGRAWGPSGHWAGLRTYDPVRDLLLLANPSDGHGGVGQTMSRQQFAQRGPFSMVRVMHKDVLPPTGGEPDPKPPTITRADLDAEIAHLTALREKVPA